MSFTLHGIPVSKGIVIGQACLMSPASLDVDHYVIEPEHIEAEVDRFFAAQRTVQQELDTLRAELPEDMPAEIDAFLNVHSLILRDSLLTGATAERIRSQRVNAEWALAQQLEHLLSYFDEVEDEYLRERKADVQHVIERVLRVLAGTSAVIAPMMNKSLVAAVDAGMGEQGPSAASYESERMIVVAHDISPAGMLHFKTQAFGGFITEYGGRTSHTAIAARSLGIPAIVGAHQASTLIRENDILIVDGEEGVVIVNPDPRILEAYRTRQNEKARAHQTLQRLAFAPAHTEDGTPIALYANIELPEDVPLALQRGAVGIGLFRTEFLFMNRRHTLPDEEEQLDVYRRVVHIMQGRPVTIRTADIGADKAFESAMVESETLSGAENPALGLRGIRWSLTEPGIFLTQLRAILRASADGPVKLLFPMLGSAREITQTLERVEQAKQQCADAGLPYDPKIKLGAMIETPAAALALPVFLDRLDFLSIGTNDLIQYTLAIDRTDNAVAHLYDPLNPSVLHLISHILRQAKQAGVPISVCGEMAGDPVYTRLLLGMGLTEFSMESSQLLHVKQEILSASLGALKAPMRALLGAYEEEDIQGALSILALAGNIELGRR